MLDRKQISPKSAGSVNPGAPHSRKARACARVAAGMATLFSLAAVMLYPAYSDTPFEYGPGSPAAVYQKEGITGMEMEMIDDVYNGVMASQDGSYCTETYYSLNINRDWAQAIQACRFAYAQPKQILLYYDGTGSGRFRVSVAIDSTDMEDVRAKEAAYHAEIDRLVTEASGKNIGEKVLYFHDCLVGRCEYDDTFTKSQAYDCLINGLSVCNGYATAFYDLCRAAGLEANYISGTAAVEGGGRISHAWNRVKMEDGQWRYYDVTWDDYTGSYQYYGLTEKEMSQDHFPEKVV